MKDRDHEKPKEQPIWMTTMTDMNMLLMVFFIALFSLGMLDKPYRFRTEQALRGLARAGQIAQPAGAGLARPEETAAFAFEQMMGKTAGEVAVSNVRGHYVRIARTSEGTEISIGGDVAPFAEGSYELRPEHREVIAEVRRWLRGKLNVILVRGHTAGNYDDSAVYDRETHVVRSWVRTDAKEIADHWVLSMLRANEVRAALCVGEEPRADERRVRVQGDAFTAPFAAAETEDERARRARNRRVEVIVTNEIVPE